MSELVTHRCGSVKMRGEKAADPETDDHSRRLLGPGGPRYSEADVRGKLNRVFRLLRDHFYPVVV
jgi:hypothetical protein